MKTFDKCIRIDNGDGTESDVAIERAYEKIRDHYVDTQPVFDQLHDGHPIRTTLATYQIVRAT